jgi:hypothetical protein
MKNYSANVTRERLGLGGTAVRMRAGLSGLHYGYAWKAGEGDGRTFGGPTRSAFILYAHLLAGESYLPLLFAGRHARMYFALGGG